MTDPYSRPSDQPDSNGPPQTPGGAFGQPGPAQQGYPQAQPYSAPPAYAPGQPAYAQSQPAYTPDGQPAYMPGAQPPAKSRKGLFIGLAVGALVLLLLLCGGGVVLLLSAADDDDPTPVASRSAGVAPTRDATSQNNNGVTANSSSDFGDVCRGGSIVNAPEFGAPATAKAYVFSNTPTRATSWSSKILDSQAPYYARSSEFSTVSVVGCLAFQEGSEGVAKKCDIKASDGTKLTVDYLSSRYTLTFFAAKTGQQIGDGGTINAPAIKCPMILSYNRETLKSYASPDSAALDAAVKKFLA